ncbi:UDP-N-acetylmuramoyl-tripeptide--D-alanyl-D-alanine ligase [subsurface metagenome]
MIYYLVAILWFIVFLKKLFFWVYLWQLKEYHLGRFRDHFRTYKGRKLILNYLLLAKILALLGIFLFASFGLAKLKLGLVYFILLLFFVEALFVFKNIWRKILKKPVLTRKTTVILSTGISTEVLILFFLFILEFNLTRFTFSLLVLDVLTPLIFSGLVLVYQPLAVILRNRIIKQAKKKRARFKDLLVIGITGSYGKTSTKEFLATILSEKFKVLKTREHQNSEVGISQCILDDLNSQHEIFVCEMGAYNRGGIKLLCDITRPKIGLLTGLNEQHMATFGSQENIIKAKYELIESLPEDGIAFFNARNKYCLELYQKTKIKKVLYGGETKPGLENIEVAIAVAKELGMSSEEIARGCQKVENQLAGFQVKKGTNGLNIVDATYSANPDGVMAHLEYLKTLPGKKVIVMPCLIELGKASKEVHRRIGKKINEVCDLTIITTKDRLKEIKEGVPNALFIENPKEILEEIKTFCQPGDTILLESRLPSQVIKGLR